MSDVDDYQLAAEVKRKSRELGFDLCGITDAGPSRHRDYFESWQGLKKHFTQDAVATQSR